jgi:beta-lactamase class A
MIHSRREFLMTAAAASTTTFATVSAAEASTEAHTQPLDPERIIDLFEDLPGNKAFEIFAPASGGKPEFRVQLNSSRKLFVASAIKGFVLGEALRQVDSPDIVEILQNKEMALNSSVWSFGSPSFNPPDLQGTVFERAVLEAMITSSDNTATDMMFKLAGVNKVREFVSAAGLTQTRIPDSTRAFAAYLFGADDFKTITWDELNTLAKSGKIERPFLNDVQTLASSAADLVSYYARALQGEFFEHRATLHEFRRILTLCDYIYLVPLPLGVSAYAKSGNADTKDFHARCIAGGIFFSNHWVYFSFVINWFAENDTDPTTVNQFFLAINRALTLVRNSLSAEQESE